MGQEKNDKFSTMDITLRAVEKMELNAFARQNPSSEFRSVIAGDGRGLFSSYLSWGSLQYLQVAGEGHFLLSRPLSSHSGFAFLSRRFELSF